MSEKPKRRWWSWLGDTLTRFVLWLLWDEPARIVFVLFVFAAVVVIGFTLVFGHALPPRACADFADYALKDIPARCVEYWTGKR